MHVRLIAVGDRQPGWVDDGFSRYAERLPKNWRFSLDVIPVPRRQKNQPVAGLVDVEGDKVLARVTSDAQLVALDERGQQFSSRELSHRLQRWQADGRDLAFVIGGPDGLAPAVLDRADATWSLSKLTLPHGLARVLFAEQVYRAWSLANGHPYHRD